MGCLPSKKKERESKNDEYTDAVEHDNREDDESEVGSKSSTVIKKDDSSTTGTIDKQGRRRTLGLISSASLTELSSFSGSSPKSDNSKDKDASSTNINPSAGITCTSPDRRNLPPCTNLTSSDVDKVDLEALVRVACSINTKYPCCDCSRPSIHLSRSASLIFKFDNVLINLLSNVHKPTHLNLSGNNAGPVAVNALIYALLQCDVVENLDLSDNMANSHCAEAIMQLLLKSNFLHSLILSGNQLGKATLSQKLSQALQSNEFLVKLNLSSCGASNVQTLFDGLVTGITNEKSSLQYLDVSNNETNDGLQLGMSVRSVLEHRNCKLKCLNIENTGLSPSGWDAVADGLKKNCSLTEFAAGGSSNRILNIVKIADLVSSNKHVSILNLKGLAIEERSDKKDVTVIIDNISSTFDLVQLNLSQCSLTDSFIAALAQAYFEKFPKLTHLDLSNNPDVTVNGVFQFDKLIQTNSSSSLTSLNLSGLALGSLVAPLANSYSTLTAISLAKSRVSTSDLCKLVDIRQVLQELNLNGIKLSKSEVLATLLKADSNHRLRVLSLQSCSLSDEDLAPVVTAFRRKVSPVDTLIRFDLDNNRIESGLKDLATALLIKPRPLEYLNVSHNVIDDVGAITLAEGIMTKNHHSQLKTLIISHNSLTKSGLLALMNTVAPKPSAPGLVTLDVSNQKTGLIEDDIEAVVEVLTSAIGLDPELALQQVEQSFPILSSSFSVNLTNLGGTAGPRTRLLDSAAIKTDFARICRTSPNLSDYLLLANGIRKMSNLSSTTHCLYSTEQWRTIVGPDAPSWLNIGSERKKGIYLSHLPGNATVQRLQGIFEMEADCVVSEIVFIKDPVFQKPSGAAWVLFDDEESVGKAVEFYIRGDAQIYSIPFSISSIIVSVADASQNVLAKSEKEKHERLLQRKKQDEDDKDLLEASQRLADERAEYREAHPAYQGGRIW